MRTSLILRIFSPKTRLNWGLLILFLFMFAVAIGPKLLSPKGVLLMLALAAGLTGAAVAVPLRWIVWWEWRSSFMRGLQLAFFGYALLVTMGHFPELYTFRVWFEVVFITPKGAVPFSAEHWVAVVGALCLFFTQRYHLEYDLEDSEVVVSGQAPITYEQAKQRAKQLLSK